MLLSHSDDRLDKQELQNWVYKVCDSYSGYLMYAELLLADEASDPQQIAYLLEKADSLKYQNVLKSESAKYLYLIAELNVRQGEMEKVKYALEQAYQKWPHPDNPALKRKQELEKSGQSNVKEPLNKFIVIPKE